MEWSHDDDSENGNRDKRGHKKSKVMPGKGPPALKVIMWGVVLFELEGAISTSKIISNFLI